MLLEILTTNIQPTLIFCVTFLVIVWLRRQQRGNLPPGPPCLPIIGSILFLRGKNSEERCTRLLIKYGNIVYVKVFGHQQVILSGYDVIKEALQMKELADRPAYSSTTEISKNHGLIQCNGQRWKEQRRFTLSALRDFGMGKLSLEGRIVDEVEVLIARIDAKQGVAFNPQYDIGKCVSNIIFSIVFGEHFGYDDPKFERFLFLFNRTISNMRTVALVAMFPVLKYIPGDPFKYHLTKESVAEVDLFLKEKISQHKNGYDPDSITDFIFAFLKEMDQQKLDPNTTFTDLQLLKLVGDLFIAGSETTTTTLRWALYFLIQNPEIQAKIQQELDEVIGPDSMPSLTDQRQLPYTQACLYEIQRCANLVPFGIPHSSTIDIHLRGYLIPKGFTVIPSLTSVLNDPNIFPEPEMFYPDRFLDNSGKVTKIDELIPFSTGQRACPGESLAKMELFLFITFLVKTYTFKTDVDQPLPPAERCDAVAVAPPPFKICAIRRKKSHC